MPPAERREFSCYLRAYTNRQVQGVYDKETAAGRQDYADLAVIEAERRSITIDTRAS